MNKNDLIDKVSKNSGLSKANTLKAVDALIEAITDSLSAGEDVRLVGFGTFLVSKREAAVGRNPRTGDEISIPERIQPKFRPGKVLKAAVNN